MFSKNSYDYYDYNLIAVMILLVGFGLVMLYSTSSYAAGIQYSNDMYLFRKQALFAILSLGFAIAFSMLDYHLLWRFSAVIYAGALVLMTLTRSPLGLKVNGARRWIRVGFLSFQPSEAAKIAVIVFIPMLIVRMGRHFRGWKAVAVPLSAGALQALFAYVFTQNLSTALIIMMISFTIIFIAYPKSWPFIAAAVVVTVLTAILVYCISKGYIHGSFRVTRILVWLNPEQYPQEGGYQTMQALYALGSGGLFGKGLGNSTQKLGALPEAYNDMIFSIICEELGVIGGVIVIMLFIYLIYRLFFIASNAEDLYGALMVSGIFAHISIQVILNICVVLNVIPTTGITLPFISYGGTSVTFLMMEMAIALSVSSRIRFKQTERDLWGEVIDEQNFV